MPALPEPCFDSLHRLLNEDHTTNPVTAKDLLIRTCYELETNERKFSDTAVMRHTMAVVFGALEKECLPAEQDRFNALKGAGLAIADHIDHRSRRATPAFHNRRHFLMVQASGRVIDRLNNASAGTPHLSAADLACAAVTDLLHDLDHPGLSNTRKIPVTDDGDAFGKTKDVYRPMTIEVRSFDRALPYLQQHRVQPDDMILIKAAVMASDPELPKDIMRSAYNRHFEPHLFSETFLEQLTDKFVTFDQPTHDRLHQLSGLLHNNPKASFMAARLGDADLLPSFGLNKERGLIETMHVNAEFVQNGNAPIYHEGDVLAKPRLFALLKILGGRPADENHYDVCFRTPGAQAIGNPVAFAFQKSAEEIIGFEQSCDLYDRLQLPFKPHLSISS